MRYFFDLLDGEQRIDLGGVELANDAAARQEAKLRALNGRLPHQLRVGHFCRIRVRDEAGRLVCEEPISHEGRVLG